MVRALSRSTMPSLLCVKPCSNVCSSGSSNVSTKLSKQRRGDLTSLVYWILLASRSSSTTPSISCVSTTPTNVSSSSSTTTCSFWNRKNTRRKASSGSPLISVWTWPEPSTLSRSQEVSWPCLKRNALCQRPPTQPTSTRCTKHTPENQLPTRSQHQRKPSKVVEISSSITTLAQSATVLRDGWRRTRTPSTSTLRLCSPKQPNHWCRISSSTTIPTRLVRGRVQLSRLSATVTRNS